MTCTNLDLHYGHKEQKTVTSQKHDTRFDWQICWINLNMSEGVEVLNNLLNEQRVRVLTPLAGVIGYSLWHFLSLTARFLFAHESDGEHAHQAFLLSSVHWTIPFSKYGTFYHFYEQSCFDHTYDNIEKETTLKSVCRRKNSGYAFGKIQIQVS